MEALGVRKGFAIAVSGGRDSMALARLSAAYANSNNVSVLALTVDHGLRPESAREAVQVAAWCAAAGLRHRALAWDGEKPATGVQEAARNARYGLLVRAAQAAGHDVILAAHSADDQSETVFMRLARGSGPRGLSVMSEAAWIAAGADDPIRLLRPLLSVSRANLTATVEAFNQPFVDDPSNEDPAYERIRTRALLAALEEQGLLTQKAMSRTAARMRNASRLLRSYEEALFQSLSGCFYQWGGASLDVRACRGKNADDVAGLCQRLIFSVSGEARPPDADAAGAAFVTALAKKAATLGGALLKSDGDRLWFLREPAAVLGRAGTAPLKPQKLVSGARRLWDGRFIVETPPELADLEVAPLGAQGFDDSGGKPPFPGPEEALRAMPGVYRDGALIGAPFALSTTTPGLRLMSLCRERFDGEIIRFS